MVVDLNDAVAVVDYTRAEAAKGLEHVTTLVQGERDAMIALIDDLTEYEAEQRINDGEEFSVVMILQHLNNSFDRSRQRLATLIGGEPFVPAPGQAGVAGGLPEEAEPSFDRLRDAFRNGSDAVVDILLQADPATPTTATSDHAQYGPFNWLEWAVYSHHVHTSDHVHQVRKIRDALRG